MEVFKSNMDRLLEILEEIIPGEDVENCKTLVDDNILDSFAIISLVSALEEEYDITISPAELVPENFNSAEALWEMIQELSE
jgi:acyl carrier protein